MKDAGSSRTINISDYFMKEFVKHNPDIEIQEIDLFAGDIPGIDRDVFDAWGMLQQGKSFDKLSDTQKQKLAKINELTDQFIAADRYIFSFPMWNLACPAEIKKYIDNITVVGKTFKYTEKGPVGLLSNAGRKAMVISTYGGFHLGKTEDFCTPYVESLLKFLGIEDVETIVAEGLDAMPDKTAAFVESAKKKAEELAGTF